MDEQYVGEFKANITTLFKQDEDINKRLDRIETEQNQLKEITTILKITQKQYEDHHKLIEQMHDNLIEMNGTVKNLKSDMDNVKQEVGQLKDDSKFDFKQFMKEITYKVIPSAIGTLLIAYLLWRFGVK